MSPNREFWLSVVELDGVEDGIWEELASCLGERGHGFRTPVIGTVAEGLPTARTVVLRRVDRDEAVLEFHTDGRSAKVAGLRDGGVVAWTFWDRALSLQLRARGRAELIASGSVHRDRWEATPEVSRRNYQTAAAPGVALDHPGDGLVSGSDGSEHFLVVRTRVTELDWLSLRESGQRRAVFRCLDGAWSGSWVIP